MGNFTFCSHSLQYKINKQKSRLRNELTIKRFNSEMVFFELDWEEINSYGQNKQTNIYIYKN